MEQQETTKILKITTIFGGAQIIIVIAGLLKSKIAAIFIGPEGVGISSIYNNSLIMITNMVGLGISMSAIREIAQTTDYMKKYYTTITRRLLHLLAAIGFIFTLTFSFLLSNIQFGSSNYVIGFCIIAIAVYFSVASTANDACLKGFGYTKEIALTSLINSIVSMLICCVLYYTIGMKSIPYAIALGALTSYCISRYFSRNIIKTQMIPNISICESFVKGKQLILLGVMLVISSLIDSFVVNFTNVVISIFISIGFW